MRPFSSHGNGRFDRSAFASIGENVVIEEGALVFHPETIRLGSNVYVGHQAILKGYYKGWMEVGDGTWIGQQCFFHSAGGLRIGKRVGIGPCVRILTSSHEDAGPDLPIMDGSIRFAEVVVGDGCDLGVGSILLPGVRLGRGVQVGAGAVVAEDLPDFSVAAGVPARVLRFRGDRA